ncbi:MAG TPA: EthD family reductase [Cyclobacteriaceae bacterium]|nr:EthD family reductase [Cyclobacteriaceae bacterium]
MKSKTLFFLLFTLVFASAFAQKKNSKVPASKKGMICVTIFYANGEGKTFDMDYYSKTHMPLVKESCGDALKMIEIDKGIAGGAPDAPATYAAIGYLYFDSVESYRTSISPHIDKIRADIPKFTNITPVIQISEVVQ